MTGIVIPSGRKESFREIFVLRGQHEHEPLRGGIFVSTLAADIELRICRCGNVTCLRQMLALKLIIFLCHGLT
jgi:hypothetical protein